MKKVSTAGGEFEDHPWSQIVSQYCDIASHKGMMLPQSLGRPK